MNYIIRKSESDNLQLSIEPLQDGYIFRFNSEEHQSVDPMEDKSRTIYVYDEIWIEDKPSLEEINEILPKNCILNQEQLDYITN